MDARKTDEIICGNCGRPNLKEAEKCWYCQTPLVKEEPTETTDDAAAESAVEANKQAAQEEKTQVINSEKDIPEWLKRVRELKAQDYPEEEEEDQWQQQGLFGGAENKSASKPARKSRKKEDQPAEKAKKEKSEQKAPQPPLDIPKKNKANKEAKEEENNPNKDSSTEELPDGFTQFRPKSN